MGPVSIGVEVQRKTHGDTPSTPAANNILRVITKPWFVDIDLFSLGGSYFQFYICGINV